MNRWLEQLRSEIERSTAGLSDADWKRAPRGAWCSAEIMEHLGRSYGSTAKLLELGLGSGNHPQVRPASLQQTMKRLVSVDLGFFPGGLQAPLAVLPQGDEGPVALERALNNLTRMEKAIAAAEERWGDSQPVAMHMILGPMSSPQWRKFHYLHGHHHLRQLRKRVRSKV
jgi:hypothetical protein